MSYRTLGFPEYGVTNAINCNCGFTPYSNPKRVNTKKKKRVTERTSIYLKTPRLIKQCHSLPYSVLRMRKGQCKHFECGFTPVSNPKMIKRGNKIGIYLCKRTKVKITDMAYLRLLRVRTDQRQCKYRKLAFTPDRNPKRGNKKG